MVDGTVIKIGKPEYKKGWGQSLKLVNVHQIIYLDNYK